VSRTQGASGGFDTLTGPRVSPPPPAATRGGGCANPIDSIEMQKALKQVELGRVYGAQELHELITDLGGGFVLYPVAHIVEFERPEEPGKAGAQLVHRQWIELFQAIRLSPNEKGRLRDVRAFESGGEREIMFGGAVIVQAAVKAGA